MASMRASHGGDARRMAGHGKPVMDRRANTPPFKGWFSLALMAGNQEENSIARRNRALKRPVDRFPCAIEAVTMKV